MTGLDPLATSLVHKILVSVLNKFEQILVVYMVNGTTLSNLVIIYAQIGSQA